METLTPTPRQLELLVLHTRGLTFYQIGEQVHLSPETIKTHLDELRSRLGASSLSNAVIICIARGYICVDGRSEDAFIPDVRELELVA